MNDKCKCVVFTNKAYNAIVTETFRKNPLETGGILLGHVLENGYWIVMEVLPPGWRSTFQYAYFEYDDEFVNYVAQSESRKYRHQLSVLGLWHRHPGSFDSFSGTDDQTNATFARLRPHGAISGLVNVDPRFRLTMFHCDYPLQYSLVDVEVGDDLIPAEYFELNYYDDGKDLNPMPGKEDIRKKELANLEISSANPSSTTTTTDSSNQNAPTRKRNPKFVAVSLCFSILALIMFVLAGCLRPYSKSEKSYHDMAIEDKYTEAYVKTELVQNELKAVELDTTKIDNYGAKLEAFIAKEKKRNKIKELKPEKKDSLIKVFEDSMLYIQKDLKKNELIGEFADKLDEPYENATQEELNWVGVLAIVLFNIGIFNLLLSILFAILYFKRRVPRNPNGRPGKGQYWFQKDQQRFLNEDGEIRKRFQTAEKSVSGGLLTYTISADKRVANNNGKLIFQMVYPADYPDNKAIRFYLISPDFNELFGSDISKVKAIHTDESGEQYIMIDAGINGSDASGMEAIRRLYQWLQRYSEWQSGKIKISNIEV